MSGSERGAEGGSARGAEHLDRLESASIALIREAYATVPELGMLWSIGKDSTVLLWLARKAFFGHVPIPLLHVDTAYKVPGMLAWRDQLARDWGLTLLVVRNEAALAAGESFPQGRLDRVACCRRLKTEALQGALDGSLPRLRLDLGSGQLVPDAERARPFGGVLLGIRADEEGTRAKERSFSPRDAQGRWDVKAQPAELWGQYHTDFPRGTHVRVHPLLDWTELDVWEYVRRESIPLVPLYFDAGTGQRYRSLGCAPCTLPVASSARTPAEVLAELRSGRFARVAERAGRAQDQDDGGGLETLRRGGYM